MTYSSAADGPTPGRPPADDDTGPIPAYDPQSAPADRPGGSPGDDDADRPGADRPGPDGEAREHTDGAARPAAVPLGGGGRIRGQLRRRRRLVVAAVSVLAGLLALALCGGLVAGLAALDRSEDRGDRDERDGRRGAVSREADCLELEKRLNQVSPPGAAVDPPRRAAAIRDENAALRPYLTQVELRGPARDRDGDRLAWWRQLLDARTAYAEALDRQAAAKTPAFFLPSRMPNGAPLAQRLVDSSPGACAGSIRRLAAPDL